MSLSRRLKSLVTSVFGVWSVTGLVTGVAAGDAKCSADIAGSVVGTFIVTLLLCGVAYFIVTRCHKSKGMKTRPFSSRENIRESEVDGGRYAYDNPYFHDDEPDGRVAAPSTLDTAERGEVGPDLAKGNSTLENKANANKQKKGKSSKANLLSVLTNNKLNRHRALDDSCINLEPEKVLVPLRGIDFTGLGFNVCGNMRDGIFIKDVLHRGPAMESGKIKAGDRILSVTVSFTNMVYEDALTILSYASPYDVQLAIQKGTDSALHHIPGHQKKGSNASNMSVAGGGGGERVYHPLYRSHSIGDIYKLGQQDESKRPQSQSIATAGPSIKPSNKKETLVRTSQSLREESSTDLQLLPESINGAKPGLQPPPPPASLSSAAEYSSTDSLDSDGKMSKASRFQVRKVSEAGNEEKGVVSTGVQPKLDKGGNKKQTSERSSRSSTSSSEGDNVNVTQTPVNIIRGASSESPPFHAISFKPEEILDTISKSDTTSLDKQVTVEFHPSLSMSESINKDTQEKDRSRTSSSSSTESRKNKDFSIDLDEIQLTLEEPVNLRKSPQSVPIPAKRNTAPGKRKAPPPPASSNLSTPSGEESPNDDEAIGGTTAEVQQHTTRLQVSPDIHAVPSWVTNDGQEKEGFNDALPENDKNVAIQTNFSSDSSDSENEENKAKLGALGDSKKLEETRSTNNAGKTKGCKQDKNRRATSLGDLTTVQETGQKSFPLERSVSMDLDHAGALPVQGQLGKQREHNKLAMVGENGGSSNSSSDEMLAPVPLKKHNFTARENLHLADIGSDKDSWEDLEKNQEDQGSPSKSPTMPNWETSNDLSMIDHDNEYTNKRSDNRVMLDAIDDPSFLEDKFERVSISSSDNGEEVQPQLPPPFDPPALPSDSSTTAKELVTGDDNMSDVSLSDREISDVMSSMSDDSINTKKVPVDGISPPTKKIIVKKMIPVTVSKDVQSSSSSSESDDEHYKPSSKIDHIHQEDHKEQSEVITSAVIHHDAVTGSSLVTIGSPAAVLANKEQNSSVNTIDPHLAKLFNNVTVSNASKEPITLDIESWTVVSADIASQQNSETINIASSPPGTRNGAYKRLHVDHMVDLDGSDDQDSSSSLNGNGNGTVSPSSNQPEQQYETTLEMDVSGNGDSTRHENTFGLISFETCPPQGPLQKSTENLYTHYPVSEGAISKAVIISNPQLSSQVTDHLTSTVQEGMESPPPTLEPPPE